MSKDNKKVFSAIQPTGDPHLGNYFGAIKNWVNLQNDYECRFSVVDYHSMTMPYNAVKLRENSWKMTFQLLAGGVDPSNLFVQSLVPEHTELSWILSTQCSYGHLQRMTQFKDKSTQVNDGNKEGFISAGLLFYPVLQAADILIYKAGLVPVGKDQEQHLELSRAIANRFNHNFKVDYFDEPQCLFTEVPKVLSLADPTKKMSKSLGEKHYINMFGDPKRISKQVRSAVTDAGDTTEMSPGVKNLFLLLKACEKVEIHDVLMATYNDGNLRYGDLKKEVETAVLELTTGFKESYDAIMADKKKYKNLILESSREIRKEAQQTLKEVREITGLLNLK